jgi:hypothetical protein
MKKGTRMIYDTQNDYDFCKYVENFDEDFSIVQFTSGENNGKEIKVLTAHLHFDNPGNVMAIYNKYNTDGNK